MSNLIKREHDLSIQLRKEIPHQSPPPEIFQPEDQLTLNFLWQVILRRRWIVLGVAALALLITGLV